MALVCNLHDKFEYRYRESATINAQLIETDVSRTFDQVMTDFDAFIRANLPAVVGDLPYTNFEVTDWISLDRDNVLGYSRHEYDVAIHYGSTTGGQESEQDDREFDTTGATVTFTHALQETVYKKSGRPDVAFNKQILVSNDDVQGADVVIPAARLSYTTYRAPGSMGAAFVQSLYRNTGKTNDASFQVFAAGEALYLGAKISQTGRGRFRLTHEFVGSANATNLTVGSISNIAKQGHQFLWIDYETKPDATSGKQVREPAYVVVNTLYESFSFAGLGIPTVWVP